MEKTNEKIKLYEKSEEANFYVIDTIGVPHPYCITPKHIEVASDEFCGMLGKEAIEEAEKKGAVCNICKHAVKNHKQDKILSFAEHGQALLIACKKELQIKGKTNPELQKYLLKIKEQCERDGFVGFAFKKAV